MPRTIVLGASPNPNRASWVAVKKLLAKGEEVIALGRRPGQIEGLVIQTQWPKPELLHPVETVTLYLNPSVQASYCDYILAIAPRRIIFNPGTENPELAALARAQGIEPITACALVMLSLDQY